MWGVWQVRMEVGSKMSVRKWLGCENFCKVIHWVKKYFIYITSAFISFPKKSYSNIFSYINFQIPHSQQNRNDLTYPYTLSYSPISILIVILYIHIYIYIYIYITRVFVTLSSLFSLRQVSKSTNWELTPPQLKLQTQV